MALQIPQPIIQGDVQDQILRSLDDSGLGALAPFLYIDRTAASYLVARDTSVISESEAGYDPKIPVSRNAPAREVVREREQRTADLDKYFEYVPVERVLDYEVDDAYGLDLVAQATMDLAQLHYDRIQWLIADLYSDGSNFGRTSASIDFSAGAADIVKGIMQEIAAVRPSNSAPGGYTINLVASTDVAAALRSIVPVAAGVDTPVVGEQRFGELFGQLFGARVQLFTGSAQYVANVSGGGALKPMWSDGYLAITATSNSPSSIPSFAITPAFNQLAAPAGAGDDVTLQGLDQRLVDVYTTETDNPRGTRVYAESFFRVESANKSRGSLITTSNV